MTIGASDAYMEVDYVILSILCMFESFQNKNFKRCFILLPVLRVSSSPWDPMLLWGQRLSFMPWLMMASIERQTSAGELNSIWGVKKFHWEKAEFRHENKDPRGYSSFSFLTFLLQLKSLLIFALISFLGLQLISHEWVQCTVSCVLRHVWIIHNYQKSGSQVSIQISIFVPPFFLSA